MDIATVARLFRAAGVCWIRIETRDIHGIARSKSVPLSKFPAYAAKGVNFYGGMLLQDASGWDIPLEEELPPPDYLLKPDLDTLTLLPYAPGEARVIGDLYRDGAPAPEDPRVVCRRIVERFRERGWIPRSAFEYEFYLLHAGTREPVFRDKQICSTLRNNFDPAWRDELLTALEAHGIAVSTLSVENAPGQFEITIDPADGIAAADQAFMFRTVVKEVSRKHGYIATFMTKPFIDQAASGTHLHHSLIDASTGQNLFADPDGPHGLSELAWHFLGGLFEHARALIAVFSPTPNDYKRYQPGLFAPTSVCWGYDNRSAAFRIPADAHGSKARIENRLGGAAAHPYIPLAASLAAGWTGSNESSSHQRRSRRTWAGSKGCQRSRVPWTKRSMPSNRTQCSASCSGMRSSRPMLPSSGGTLRNVVAVAPTTAPRSGTVASTPTSGRNTVS